MALERIATPAPKKRTLRFREWNLTEIKPKGRVTREATIIPRELA
jgi:hypothetical protein